MSCESITIISILISLFRNAWKELQNLKNIFPASPLLMLTATCSQNDAHKIMEYFGLNHINTKAICGSMLARKEIAYEVQKKRISNKENLQQIIDTINNNLTTGRCIIYCASPSACQNISSQLQGRLSSICDTYYGTMPDHEKTQSLQNWKNGITKIMVATNAFGMGINVSDVYLVIHHTAPLSLSKYLYYFIN